jgi:hypothetical protein
MFSLMRLAHLAVVIKWKRDTAKPPQSNDEK